MVMAGFRGWCHDAVPQTLQVGGNTVVLYQDRHGVLIEHTIIENSAGVRDESTIRFDQNQRVRERVERHYDSTAPHAEIGSQAGLLRTSTTEYDVDGRIALIDDRTVGGGITEQRNHYAADGTTYVRTVEYASDRRQADGTPQHNSVASTIVNETMHPDGTVDRRIVNAQGTTEVHHEDRSEVRITYAGTSSETFVRTRQPDNSLTKEIFHADGTGHRMSESPDGRTIVDRYTARGGTREILGCDGEVIDKQPLTQADLHDQSLRRDAARTEVEVGQATVPSEPDDVSPPRQAESEAELGSGHAQTVPETHGVDLRELTLDADLVGEDADENTTTETAQNEPDFAPEDTPPVAERDRVANPEQQQSSYQQPSYQHPAYAPQSDQGLRYG